MNVSKRISWTWGHDCVATSALFSRGSLLNSLSPYQPHACLRSIIKRVLVSELGKVLHLVDLKRLKSIFYRLTETSAQCVTSQSILKLSSRQPLMIEQIFEKKKCFNTSNEMTISGCSVLECFSKIFFISFLIFGFKANINSVSRALLFLSRSPHAPSPYLYCIDKSYRISRLFHFQNINEQITDGEAPLSRRRGSHWRAPAK